MSLVYKIKQYTKTTLARVGGRPQSSSLEESLRMPRVTSRGQKRPLRLRNILYVGPAIGVIKGHKKGGICGCLREAEVLIYFPRIFQADL